MSRFKNEAESIKDEIIAIRRTLHENPEIGYEEFNTSRLIKEFLTKEGIVYEEYAKIRAAGNHRTGCISFWTGNSL